MTLQEKIIKEYKEYWELFSTEEHDLILKNNGWVSKFNHPLHWEMVKFYEIETLAYGVGTSWRPKSLKGIENNNGWIKIESEESLPKEYDFYDACCFSEKFTKDIPMFHGCNLPDLRNYFDEELITHYRPIVKHDYPLF